MRIVPRFVPASFLAACFALASTAALAQAPGATTPYEPVRAQSGKDVIWIPTPEALVDKMLSAAQVTPSDKVFDLGAGDGIIAITAAKKYGANAVGIEFNPQMADYARRKAREAGVADKVRIITGDIFKEDFSEANVVTLYLLPDLNLRLRPTLLAMKPGTRIVSHAFTMGAWEPDETMNHESARGYLWIVPAKADGEWTLTSQEGPAARITLRQNFQSIGGMLNRANVYQPLVGARLRGEEIRFQFTGADRTLHTFSGRIRGDRISGTLESAAGVQVAAEMARR